MRNLMLTFVLPLIAFSALLSADQPDPRKLMEAVENRDDGDRMIAQMEMILIDKAGHQRVRKMQRFNMDKGEDTYSLIFFLEPADVEDTGFLTYDYDDPEKDDDQWLFLPALKKSKRIASSDKSGSFMGSDFTYADMTTKETENYDYTLVKQAEVRGHDTWIIQAIPRTQEEKEETGYTKALLFVRPDINMVVRAVYYVDNGDLKYFDIPELKEIDGIWTALEIQMTTKKGKVTYHQTILKNHNTRYNQKEVSDDLFTVRRLEKGL